jgi:hypothetical protein
MIGRFGGWGYALAPSSSTTPGSPRQRAGDVGLNDPPHVGARRHILDPRSRRSVMNDCTVRSHIGRYRPKLTSSCSSGSSFANSRAGLLRTCRRVCAPRALDVNSTRRGRMMGDNAWGDEACQAPWPIGRDPSSNRTARIEWLDEESGRHGGGGDVELKKRGKICPVSRLTNRPTI